MKHLTLFPMASKYCLGPVSNLFTGPVVPAKILRGSIFSEQILLLHSTYTLQTILFVLRNKCV